MMLFFACLIEAMAYMTVALLVAYYATVVHRSMALMGVAFVLLFTALFAIHMYVRRAGIRFDEYDDELEEDDMQ